jgi:CRISPR-associated protein Csd1
MSGPNSSPISALIGYYRRLEGDPAQTAAEFGFSREKIHFQVLLEPDGSLAGFDDLRDVDERSKPTPRLLLVPDAGGRSGTGLKPFFCWDNTGYALGRDDKGKPARAEKMFTAFRELHLSMWKELQDDEGYTAVCRFLERWTPARAESLARWDEAAGLNIVFKLRGREEFVHQHEMVREVWLRRVQAAQKAEVGARGTSLISGTEDELARLHPLISGVSGTNTTGAAIVSFNLDAFTSYGKTQSYNAPVGVQDAFRYTAALNQLLSDDQHRVRIGDATVVFWTDRAAAADAEDLFGAFFGEEMQPSRAAEHGATLDRLRAFLTSAEQGRLRSGITEADAPFYVLGLSPNASRISVRYWLAGTVAQFAERLLLHVAQLAIVRPASHEGDPPLIIRQLLAETARTAKDIMPTLAGDTARAVLGGIPYPQQLLASVIRRIRTDGELSYRRAAILKAFLIRNRNQEVPVALNRDRPEAPYQIGRLFAALEKTQEDASGGKLNRTIRDSFFGAAAATPAIVFPRLMRLHQHHLAKYEHPAFRVNREKLVGEICGRITRFPPHLSLEQQGLFYVGYYHQRQDLFTKKDDTSTADTAKEQRDE